ncbi:hypothetical protein [Nocardia wallacei]|uniref:hypothetical protein n=1 Tax=Nocardia wallacei TaxID=480035 RepID=UPI00245609CB|nr:hypothetical protein [Nocardia wallacei]
MTSDNERDQCRVTIDGAAPSLVTVFRRAVRIATEHGRTWVGVEDLQAALLWPDGPAAQPMSLLEIWWPRAGQPRRIHRGMDVITPADLQGDPIPLSYSEFRELVRTMVPGPTPGVGPEHPASVAYRISGPHAAEYRRQLGEQ